MSRISTTTFSRLLCAAFSLVSFALSPAEAKDLDLTAAVVVASENASPQERKAVQMLIEEVEKRTQIRLPLAAARPPGPAPTMARSTRMLRKVTAAAPDP